MRRPRRIALPNFFHPLPGAVMLQWLLLLGLVGSLAFGLLEAGPSFQAAALLGAAWLGLLLAWLAAGRPNRGRAAWLIGAGAAWSLDQALQLHPALFSLGRAGANWLAGAAQALAAWMQQAEWRAAVPWPEAGDFTAPWNQLSLSAAAAGQRLSAWFAGLFSGSAPADALVTGMLWSMAVWLAAAWAGWWSRRALYADLPASSAASPASPALRAGAPALLLLAGVSAVARLNASGLLVGTVCLAALQVVNSAAQRTRSWQRRGLDTAAGLNVDLGLWAGMLGLGALALAYALAKPSPQGWMQRLAQANPPRLEQDLGLNRPAAPATPTFNAGILPRRHLIGAGPELSQRLVMAVQVSALPAAQIDPSTSLSDNPFPDLYWSGVTYDVFTGQGWYTSYTRPQDLSPGAALYPLAQGDLPLAALRVQMIAIKEQVYFAGLPLSLDQAVRADWRPSAGPPDLFRLRLNRPAPGGVYHLQAALPNWTPEQLQAASAPPPAWAAPYLAAPPTSPRVRDLSRRITLSRSTPYARALAIQAYLRQVPYTLDLPAPPAGADIVDYFLFDLRRGYCDYYATAMAALARLNGLPARLAVGYAPGRYDPARSAYFITEAQAHAWPEIYFTGLGWVRFEPTAALPLAGGPPALLTTPPARQSPAEDAAVSSAALRLGRLLGIGLAYFVGLLVVAGSVSIVVSGLAYLLEGRLLNRLPPHRLAERLYSDLRRQARRLGLAVAPGATPAEFGAQLSEWLITPRPRRLHPLGRLLEEQLSRGERLRRQTAPRLLPIIALYGQYCYSPNPPPAALVQQARLAAPAIRRWLWWEKLSSRREH